jgi:V/A-type H+-transporting ATPase subunit I
MISRMTGVEVVGPLRFFEAAVDAVQESGLLHVVEMPLLEGLREGELHRIRLSEAQAQERRLLEELLHLLEEGTGRIGPAMRAQLEAGTKLLQTYRRLEGEKLSAVASAVRVVHSKVRSLARRERNLDDDLQVLSSYEEVVAALAPLVEDQELPPGYELRGVIFEKKSRMAGELLDKELGRLTGGRHRFRQSGLDGGRSVALVGFPRELSSEVRDFIAKAGIAEMSFPHYLRNQPFEQALAALESDLEILYHRRRVLADQARSFYEENGLRLLALHHVCRDRLERYEACAKFARSEYAFVIRGWMVSGELDRLGATLRERADPTVVVRAYRASSMGTPPVLLSNPQPVKAFEPLLSLLPLPRYGSIDPTKFLATFFPPMFGLMLGDVGYGLLVAAGAVLLFLLRRRKAIFGQLAVIAASCALFTIGFGLVFGELFGSFGHQLGLRPLWRERFSLSGHDLGPAILGYLAIAVGIGVLQVMFGLILGLINARRVGDRQMILGNLARIAGILVLFFFVGRLVQLLPPIFSSLGIVALVAFLVIMIYQTVRHPIHGLMLPLEVLGVLGNILSYARLMAIGLASVVLALLATTLAGLIGNVVLAAIIIILVHALNLALGIIDPTIQGLRLHYVEFFSKFLLSGGKKFTPFNKLGGAIA